MPSLLPTSRAFLALLLLGVAASGCDHGVEPDGPNLIDRFGPFVQVEPLAASQPTVDFAAGQSVVFTAQFNKQVAWVLTITGQESGAVRVIEGFSRELTADNARWNGRTTELPFFRAEAVNAVLTIPDEEASQATSADVEVVAGRTYAGNVFEDFEGQANVFVGNFEFEFQNSGISSEVPAGEGESFYVLRGTEAASGPTRNFFVGLIDIRPDGRGLFPVPTTVPEDLYVNFLLRGFGTDFTIAVVQLVVDKNGTGAYELDQDTTIPFGDIPVDFEGWRLFSKPVSALGTGEAPASLTQEQAANIVGVRVVLISDNNGQPATPQQVAFGIDYITFTAGGPLQP